MNNLSFAIIIPARGGSKRIPRKNIALLRGKPLLLYTVDAIKEAGLLDKTYVSTEDAEIASVAKDAGAHVLERPMELASDTASTEEVLLHAITVLASSGVQPEWVMTLTPTHPFRSAQTILQCLEEAKAASEDGLFSVTETVADFWKKNSDGVMERIFPHAPRAQQKRREQGQVLFEENSAIYLTRVQALREAMKKKVPIPILGNRYKAIPIPRVEGLDVNDKEDMQIAEALLATRLL